VKEKKINPKIKKNVKNDDDDENFTLTKDKKKKTAGNGTD
jgi:hypothetical protein